MDESSKFNLSTVEHFLSSNTVHVIQIRNLLNKQLILSTESSFYLYDHPPSTGSYRAASIPEPPDADWSSLRSAPVSEPVYDEIPCYRKSLPINQPPPPYRDSDTSLYMNTIGTRFWRIQLCSWLMCNWTIEQCSSRVLQEIFVW